MDEQVVGDTSFLPGKDKLGFWQEVEPRYPERKPMVWITSKYVRPTSCCGMYFRLTPKA
jgi:hypothetical protein